MVGIDETLQRYSRPIVQETAAEGMMQTEAEGKKPRSILFVCTGNICRSPMAEALFRKILRDQIPDWQSWRVESAGTWASEGTPVSVNSVRVMNEYGINIASHTARLVRRDLLETFDVILAMEPGHKEALQIEFPDLASRVHLLSEMSGALKPVEDPYGGSLEEYRDTARVIDQMLTRGLQRILSLANAVRKSENQSKAY